MFEVDLPGEWNANGYVTTLDGRRKYCERVTEAKNTPVQAFEAIVMKQAMKVMHKEEFKILIMQHDAAYVEIPDDKHFKERSQRFIQIMETARPDLLECFPTKLKVGNNWLEVS